MKILLVIALLLFVSCNSSGSEVYRPEPINAVQIKIFYAKDINYEKEANRFMAREDIEVIGVEYKSGFSPNYIAIEYKRVK